MREKFWLALSLVPGMGRNKLLQIYHAAGTLVDIESQEFQQLMGPDLYNIINRKGYLQALMEQVEELFRRHHEQHIKVITYFNEQYPQALKNIERPPLVLFGKGNIAALKIFNKLAIIGNRDATAKGIEVAEEIAARFVRRGYAIIGGLAKGIDTGGHTGALQAGGVSIALLPGGLDDIRPKSNASLADRIAANNGLLLTEYPLGHEFHKKNYIDYCRLQSGLALGVCPVQTDVDSGTMYTVAFAESQGKVIFCPWPIEDESWPQYRGVKKLLGEGRAIKLAENKDYGLIDALMTKAADEPLSSK